MAKRTIPYTTKVGQIGKYEVVVNRDGEFQAVEKGDGGTHVVARGVTFGELEKKVKKVQAAPNLEPFPAIAVLEDDHEVFKVTVLGLTPDNLPQVTREGERKPRKLKSGCVLIRLDACDYDELRNAAQDVAELRGKLQKAIEHFKGLASIQDEDREERPGRVRFDYWRHRNREEVEALFNEELRPKRPKVEVEVLAVSSTKAPKARRPR